jgi:Amidohydrolase family
MKKILYTSMLFCCTFTSFAQTIISSGVYLLHKFERNIGKETYTETQNGNNLNYTVDFKYVDRGSPVSLTASLLLTPTLEPVSLLIRGGTSRFSSVNDSVVINNKMASIKVDDSLYIKTLQPHSFIIAGYSPATAQMLLVQYWKKHNKPATINTLPYGSVQIKKDGNDTVSFNNKAIMLERYVIKGLIWGNELLWMDSKGKLYCLITNDAEGDKQEMMLEPYESLLPVFINKAAMYGMRLFTNSAKPSFQKHNLIAITGGTLIDVVNDTTIPNSTIIIENGIIKNAGSSNAVEVPAHAFIIDAKGKTILPGLWDMHAHFEQAEWGPAYLAAGVTTVRDCGNEFGYINAIQKAIDDGSGIGPHILKAGIIDGKGPYSLGIIQADKKEEAIAAVDRYKENGFVQIKIYSSVKPAIVKVICDEAHRLGLTVTGHIPDGMTLMQGVDSGMDMVNHVQYVFSVMKKNRKDFSIDLTDSANAAVLDFIKTHHVVIDPTLGVFELAFRSLKDSITDIEPAFSTLPEPMKPLFINTGATDSNQIRRGKIIMKDFKEITGALYRDKITIVAGTDMGFPGYSVFRELELYVECGLTPMQAIQTATITPAKVMKMDKVTGSIETGKRADIIIVDGDPLQNIRNIRKIESIIKDGNIYDPAILHKVAGFNK